MQLEYLSEGSIDCPLLRLFDFDSREASCLLLAIRTLTPGHDVLLHRLPFVTPVNECCLTLSFTLKDEDVVQVGPTEFQCRLTDEGWLEVADRMEPFVAESQGFTWLSDSPIKWLLSPSGHW